MAYYDGDFDQFLEDRLKQCKTALFSSSGTRPQSKMGKSGSSKFKRKLVWLVVTYLVVVGLLFGSVGTVFAAMDSLPNDSLYAVKLAGEDLQLLLTSDINARISLLTSFSNRRAVEASILASQGEPIPEQLSVLIDEYQAEIVTLTATLEDEEIPVVGIQKHPRDRDSYQGSANPIPEQNMNLIGEQPGSETLDQSMTMMDIEVPDPVLSVTGTIGISRTMNMTQTRSGSNNGSGQENRQEYSPGPAYGPGPTYGPSDVVPYGPGPNYGPGNSGVIPQQPPTTNPQAGNGSANQPTENKGNKP